jgi:hypothetical protein
MHANSDFVRAQAFRALGYSWPTSAQTQSKFLNELIGFMKNHFLVNIWNIRTEILSSTSLVLSRMHEENMVSPAAIQDIVTMIGNALEDTKYSAIRSSGISLLSQLINVVEGNIAYLHIVYNLLSRNQFIGTTL